MVVRHPVKVDVVGSSPTSGVLFGGGYLNGWIDESWQLSLSSSLVENKMMLESDPSKGKFTRF